MRLYPLNRSKQSCGCSLLAAKWHQSFYAWMCAVALAVLVINHGVYLVGTWAATGTPVSLTTLGTAYTQDFNTLATTGMNNSSLPVGWALTETGGGARDNEQYAADNGASNTGDTYSYGAMDNTERAFGGLQSGTLIPIIGACFTNNTGATVTSLAISYTGEQWRIGNSAAARDDRLDFQYSTDATSLATGTWTDVDSLDFINPIKTAGTSGALDGNAAMNRTVISFTIGGLSIANGATFFIRWTDLNASGADDGLSVDDFSVMPQGGTPQPTLNISDVTMAEGDPPGTTTFTFAVTLTSAAASDVTFDIAAADGTAQDGNPGDEDNDYVTQSLIGQTISMGSTGPYNFSVTVNRDTVTEPNETFFVNVTNVTGATAGDIQGQGTITNDDVTLTPIHDIQGLGASSPIVGSSVTTRGIVTGVKSNGFFIQEPDASADADPATSEGILVFTSSAPPAAVAVGNQVQVMGTVAEFVPSADPLQPPLTELTSPTVVQLSTGNPLPAAIPLTATFPNPAGVHDQLERLEGMRVSVSSLTVVGPTQGNISEANATGSSNGVFYGVVTGVARPFREPGIQAPDPSPSGSGTIPPLPRFDSNPERIRVDSDGLVGGTQLNVKVGAVVTGAIGPLDYSFRTYTILPDPASPLMASGGMIATPVTMPSTSEFTVASYNLERFFDDVNDPSIGEPVLSNTAYTNRLNKASLGIRNFLRTPDILGVVEVENLTTLQALATKINNDAVAASQPNPNYVAQLVEGNDIGGIDVGFLVKTAIVMGSTPRVAVNAVVQENRDELFVNPDNSTDLLNDRPPLRLDATVNFSDGTNFPITVIVVHQRSLNDVANEGAGSNGWATVGARVRAKRQKQAESLANLIQARQTNNPSERIVVVGDFNAFEFNDGLVHAMGVTQGMPVPDNETAVPGDGVDLVNPDLTLLLDSLLQRYSFVFDGNAQSLDHVLVNQAMINSTSLRRVEHPRINADFPEAARSDSMTAERLADHDPLVSFFNVDVTAPMVILSNRADGSPTNAASVSFTVTFSESVTGVDVNDFLLTTSGVAGASLSGVSGMGSVYTVMVNTGTGSGMIRLDVTDDDTIVDDAGNRLGGVGIGNGNFVVGQMYTVDKTTPSVQSSNRANPNPTSAASVNFTVTFSENVIGVDANDFSLTVTGLSGAMISNVSGGDNIYTVAVSTGSGNGTLRLDVFDNNSILDTAGNPLGGLGAGDGGFDTGQVYNVFLNCAASLSKVSESFAASGGSNSVAVTLPAGCMWMAVSNNPGFVTVNAPTGVHTGNGTVTYTVAAHSGASPRSGMVTVASQTFTVLQGAAFLDVPSNHPFYDEIGKLSARGVTLGCGGGNFCPENNATREQMAALLLRAKEGGSYLPPPATGAVFADVSASNPFAAFIEELFARGIAAGCAAGPLRYCPTSPVTREQMAFFILRTLEGGGYAPPPATDMVFADVSASNPFAAFIEELFARGITKGCGVGPLRYCPAATVMRGQMAAFLVRAFNL